MTRLLRSTLLSARDLLAAAGPFLALAAVLIALAYWLLDPIPPRRVVLATGPEQSAYASWGERYATELRRRGFEVTLRATAGSEANLTLLRDEASNVDFAFVRNGTGAAEAPPGSLLSLGALFQEPLWVFYRHPEPGAGATSARKPVAWRTLGDLAGRRLSIGEPGSGGPRLMRALLRLHDLDDSRLTLSEAPYNVAIAQMLIGQLDAVAMISAPESPLVQMLLMTPGIGLLAMDQSEAYARRLPQVQPVSLPRGIVDLGRDLPPQTVDLVAATTMLVAREQTHPALRQLFVQVADKLHRGPGWFQNPGQFPTRRDSELPIDAEANRYFDSGAPFLQRYLPFGIANLLDRMGVVLVSLIAVLLPLSRVVPPLYVFRVRSRIFRWYAQLRDIEDRLGRARSDHVELLASLDDLEQRVGRVNVPLAYTDQLYELRSHIVLVRRRLAAALTGPGGAPEAPATPIHGGADSAVHPPMASPT